MLIFVTIGICGLVVYNAYQMAHEPPPPIQPILSPKLTPQQAHYAALVEIWRKKLAEKEMTLIWPYLGQSNVARVNLPRKTPITLQDWDPKNEYQAASDAYDGFVKARKAAKLPANQTPAICIVHLFDVDGNEVAQASAAGIATAS